MVKYFFILSMLGTASSVIYQQPSCNAINTESAVIMPNPYLNFGEKIKKERVRKNWSVEQLASTVQITTAQLQDFETGKKMPKKEIVYKIEAALNVVFN